jgi:hypothetical protein
MAKAKIGSHGLKQNEGQFKLKGLVTGANRDDVFKPSIQKNGSTRNTLKFGMKTSLDNEIYVRISDSEKEKAWFYKKGDKKKGIEGESKSVAWEQRLNFHEEGFEPIGVNIGLDKDKDEKNIIVNKHDFDAAEYIAERINDDLPVRIIGDIEFNSFDGQDGKIRSKNLNIKKIYNSFVDFEKEDFIEENYFKQSFLFMGIERANGKDGKPDTEDPRFIVKGKIITYSTLEDVEFVLRNKKLGQNFQKNLKPYYCIEVFGAINNKRMEQEVENNEDDWGGEQNPFEVVNNPRKFEFEIKGINTKNIDKTTYTEQIVTDAFKANDEFGNDEWEGNQEDKSSGDENGEGYDW